MLPVVVPVNQDPVLLMVPWKTSLKVCVVMPGSPVQGLTSGVTWVTAWSVCVKVVAPFPPANAAGIPRVHNAAVLASAPLTLTKVCMTIPLLDGLTNPVDPGLSRLERSPSLRQWSLGRRRPMATPMDMSLTAGHSPRRPMRPLSAQLQPHDRDLSLRVLAQ